MTWKVLLEAAEAVRAAAEPREPGASAMTLVGIGWATVEHERAVRELDGLLGATPGGGTEAGADESSPTAESSPATESWQPAARDDLLGAGAWTRAVPGSPTLLVVLEPDTEGRLAAALVRHGEGVAAIYLRSDDRVDRAGSTWSGPLGPCRLVPGGATWGPHVIVLGERTA